MNERPAVSSDIRVGRYSLVGGVAWTLLVGLSLVVSVDRERASTQEIAVTEARAHFNKDQAFRYWATAHGGVYVPTDERTPPNTHLAHIAERDIETISGRQLTLMNPAYMLRQMMEEYTELYGVRGHITSIKPMRPANAPDPWERAALLAFEAGETEVSEITEIDNEPYLRLMKPMMTELACLKCHGHQDYAVGDVRGGVSISLPLAQLYAVRGQRVTLSALSHGLLWLLGVCSIALAGNRLGLRSRERNEAIAALRTSEQHWRETFDAVPDLIATLDCDHRIMQANKAMAKRIGKTQSECVGELCYVHMHGTDQPPDYCPHRRLLEDSREHTEQITEAHLGGDFLISASPLFGPDGSLVGCVHVARDITDRLRAEEDRLGLERQLLHTQKLESLGVLAGGIAHDFNNLLMVVLGNTELAQGTLPQDSPARENLEEIEVATIQAAELCSQMLAYSGKGNFVVGPVNLSRLVSEMADLLRISISKKAEIRFDFAPDLPRIEADATQIRQVVMNLIINASEAIDSPGGSITISSGAATCHRQYLSESHLGKELPEGSYVYLEVKDDGCGMDSETRSRLFDPFYTTKFTGRGLGLAAVQGIVQAHSGAIRIDSHPGQGTRIRVLFPSSCKPVVTEKVSDSIARRARTHTGTILLVDDEELVRSVGRKMLEALGFELVTACNGQEAIEVLQRSGCAIDLVLLDATMPIMDGFETIGELRRLGNGVPIVLASGYSEQSILDRVAGQGVVAVIQKPYQLGQLLEVIEQALDSR